MIDCYSLVSLRLVASSWLDLDSQPFLAFAQMNTSTFQSRIKGFLDEKIYQHLISPNEAPKGAKMDEKSKFLVRKKMEDMFWDSLATGEKDIQQHLNLVQFDRKSD